MSRYVRPVTPGADRAEAVISIFGVTPLRAAILRHLWQHPEGSTSGDIGRALGAQYKTVLWHLQQLEALGTVESDAGERRIGQRVLYTVNEAAFDAAAADLLKYTRGK
jgi:predicted transcriptional regulator